MNHYQRAKLLGCIILCLLPVTVYAGLEDTKLGFTIWVVGIFLLAILCPVWGFSLGRINTGRGHQKD